MSRILGMAYADRDLRIISMEIVGLSFLLVIAALSVGLGESRSSLSLAGAAECLALNVYWEARSEEERGRRAVAHLTLNRVASSDFPNSVCAVVKQGKKGRFRCQFHWFCDGRKDAPLESEAWDDAVKIAAAAGTGGSIDPTKGALYFHHRKVKPSWAKKMQKTALIGNHIYYK
jgi:spore germination cell wall hydrolase CwlJ-like protein